MSNKVAKSEFTYLLAFPEVIIWAKIALATASAVQKVTVPSTEKVPNFFSEIGLNTGTVGTFFAKYRYRYHRCFQSIDCSPPDVGSCPIVTSCCPIDLTAISRNVVIVYIDSSLVVHDET